MRAGPAVRPGRRRHEPVLRAGRQPGAEHRAAQGGGQGQRASTTPSARSAACSASRCWRACSRPSGGYASPQAFVDGMVAADLGRRGRRRPRRRRRGGDPAAPGRRARLRLAARRGEHEGPSPRGLSAAADTTRAALGPAPRAAPLKTRCGRLLESSLGRCLMRSHRGAGVALLGGTHRRHRRERPRSPAVRPADRGVADEPVRRRHRPARRDPGVTAVSCDGG